MEIALDRSSPVPLHVQIFQRIREQILTGALPVGGRLPPSRKLARRIAVNRSTVVQAYGKLWAEGLIEGKVGMGTVIQPAAASRQIPAGPATFGASMTKGRPSIETEVHDLVRLFAREDLVSFAAGLPAPELYPVDEMRRIAAEALANDGRAFLQWCSVEGYVPLRRHLAGRFDRVSLSEVMILTGSTQGLFILTQAMIEPGDFVVVQSPTYLGALQLFRSAGARVVGIPVDSHGIDIEMLGNVLSRVQPKFLYLLPTFQNPAGETMDLQTRKGILDLAYRYRVPIVEDDPYSLLRYDGEEIPPLRSLDTRGYVIYLSTFSKILTPGLRVGWMVAPKSIVDGLVSLKYRMDIFTDSLAQAIIHRFCERGLLTKHLERIRREYRKRRDAMVHGLQTHCPRLGFSRPEGGYFIWCRLPEGIVARDLLDEALRRRVSFVTGEVFSPDEREQDRIRLSFPSQTEEAITEGTRRLGLALRHAKKRGSQQPVEEELAVKPIV